MLNNTSSVINFRWKFATVEKNIASYPRQFLVPFLLDANRVVSLEVYWMLTGQFLYAYFKTKCITMFYHIFFGGLTVKAQRLFLKNKTISESISY